MLREIPFTKREKRTRAQYLVILLVDDKTEKFVNVKISSTKIVNVKISSTKIRQLLTKKISLTQNIDR